VLILSVKNWCLQSARAAGNPERTASKRAGKCSSSQEAPCFRHDRKKFRTVLLSGSGHHVFPGGLNIARAEAALRKSSEGTHRLDLCHLREFTQIRARHFLHLVPPGAIGIVAALALSLEACEQGRLLCGRALETDLEGPGALNSFRWDFALHRGHQRKSPVSYKLSCLNRNCVEVNARMVMSAW